MGNDPEDTSIDFRDVRRVPVATVKEFHKLGTSGLYRLEQAVAAELNARHVKPYEPGYQAPDDAGVQQEESAGPTGRLPRERFPHHPLAGQLKRTFALHRELPPPFIKMLNEAAASLQRETAQDLEALRELMDEQRQPAAQPADTQTGLDRAPTRYMAKGRETIDRMRDYTWHVAVASQADWWPTAAKAQDVADVLFATFCRLQAMKYRDRHGLKEGVDPNRDAMAAHFYEQLAAHVETEGKVPDPRSARPDFQPYVRQPYA